MIKFYTPFIILLLVSPNLIAGTSRIVPEDKAKLSRKVGESVYVECKKLSPFSKNCQVDCGNGRRFNKASGYCYYLSPGTFMLNVSTRYRSKDIFHTATVRVTDKSARHVATSNHQNSDNLSINTGHAVPSIPTSTTPSTSPSISNGIPNIIPSGGGSQTFNNQVSNSIQTSSSTSESIALQNQLTQNIQNNDANLNGVNNQNSFDQANNFNNINLNTGGNISNNAINNANQNQNSNQVSFR